MFSGQVSTHDISVMDLLLWFLLLRAARKVVCKMLLLARTLGLKATPRPSARDDRLFCIQRARLKTKGLHVGAIISIAGSPLTKI